VRRVLVLVAVAAAVVGFLIGLASMTKTVSDRVPPGSSSIVTFDVDIRRYPHGKAEAAAVVWAACQGTTHSRATPDGVVAADGRFRVQVRPALGEHARRRLLGCLQDMTVDRIRAHVHSIELVLATS